MHSHCPSQRHGPQNLSKTDLPNVESVVLSCSMLAVILTSLTSPRVIMVLVSTFGFITLRWVVGQLPVPSSIATGGEMKANLYKNTCVALAHALIVGAMSTHAIVSEVGSTFDVPLLGDVSPNPMIHRHSNYCYSLMSLTTGYFAYDLWDMIRCKMHQAAPHLIAHHLVLLVCYMSGLQQEMCIGYLVLTLPCELNSVALHTRALMKSCRARESDLRIVRTVYWAVWAWLWLSLGAARLFGHAVLLLQVYNTQFELGWIWWMGCIGMSVINVLNLHLLRSTYSAFLVDLQFCRFKSRMEITNPERNAETVKSWPKVREARFTRVMDE
jgi:hypothetical protein